VHQHELTKDKMPQKLVWGNRSWISRELWWQGKWPKLLQREGAVGWLPFAQAAKLERARAWLGPDDPTGTPVVGGWAFTASVLTDGVSLCIKDPGQVKPVTLAYPTVSGAFTHDGKGKVWLVQHMFSARRLDVSLHSPLPT
jgi:hypothetical protein